MTAAKTRLTLEDRVLFFPVTAFDRADRVSVGTLEQHVAEGVDHGPGAVFAACGTGEFHALSIVEYEQVLAGSLRAVAGRVPVVAGTGGPLGHARECARIAERLGADGLLIMPPYLVEGSQRGIVAHVEAIAVATDLPVIVYHRGVSRFQVSSIERLLRLPNLAGVKDGTGDVALMQQFVLAAESAGRSDVRFFNGLLTAELSQAAYRGIGVPLYSSAVFAMAPEIATAFFAAYRADDLPGQHRLLEGFYEPLVRLRDETPGFAVSLIKAGLRSRGVPVGSVRPPLTDPDPDQSGRLAELLERGRELAS